MFTPLYIRAFTLLWPLKHLHIASGQRSTMVIISKYKLRVDNLGRRHMICHEISICPVCWYALVVIGIRECKYTDRDGASVTLVIRRLRCVEQYGDFTFVRGDLEDYGAVCSLFDGCAPQVVVHLAAQAGVRYSIENPRAYVSSNIVGLFNVLELVGCTRWRILFSRPVRLSTATETKFRSASAAT